MEVNLTLRLVIKRILEHLSEPVAPVFRCFVPLLFLGCVASILFCHLLVYRLVTDWLQWSELLLLTLLACAAQL